METNAFSEIDATALLAKGELSLASFEDIPLRVLYLLVALLVIVGLSSVVLTRLRFPYTIGLVIVGLLCSWLGDWWALPLLPQVRLTENLILYVFLPALLFDAALSLNVRSLVKDLVPILLLAVPGIVFATLLTGALVHYATPLGWGSALLFGALISTTDPVAVIATFKELKAPERLTMLVDGESLFNDATAVVMFGIIAGLVSSGATPDGATYAYAAAQFLWVFLGGFAVGAVVGWVCSLFTRMGRDGQPILGILFSICAAYASFLIAQGMMGLSGVMATVGAGMVLAYMSRKDNHAETLRHIEDFWPIASFFGNSLIFLFLGLTERYLLGTEFLARYAPYMILAALIVLLARVLLVYIFVPLSNALPGQERIDGKYKAVMTWGGLRGALPIGLAVSIRPESLGLADPALAGEECRMIVLFTVSVVVFTLLVQGVSIPALMRRLGFTPADAPR